MFIDEKQGRNMLKELLYKVRMNGVEAIGLLDTGTQRSVISERLFRKTCPRVEAMQNNSTARSAYGHRMEISGETEVSLSSGKITVKLRVLVMADLTTDCIMGID